jgi:UDP-N-acetylenolpyruvoylglucosamine reductase
MDSIYQQLLRSIVAVEREVSLGSLHPLGLGGRAAYFTVAHDAMELAAAVTAAIEAQLPYEVVGQGSAVLFSDEGYAGLVIHNQAEEFILASDKSQVVVESGMPLPRFVLLAAGRGYGGLTSFYAEPGSIGGALYHDTVRGGTRLLSLVRQLTVLMPPTRMKPFATVARQKADWLKREDGLTRLRALREQRPFSEPRPVILNVQLQLTSVRVDELQRRIQQTVSEASKQRVGELTPLFLDPGLPQPLEELLHGAGVKKLRVRGILPGRSSLNAARVHREASAAALWDYTTQVIALVEERAGVVLTPAYERLGLW